MKQTGGPAYPVKVTNTTSQTVALQEEEIPGHTEFYFTGMTLRDYFAGQALFGLYANHGTMDLPQDAIAITAYSMADAMLKERVK